MFWLQKLMGTKPSSSEPQPLSNEGTAYAITRSIVDLLSAIAAEAPVLLFMDDVQWTDQTSLRLLRDIMLDSQPVGLLIVMTSREERPVFDVGDWGDHLVARQIGALDRQVSLDLLSSELSSLSKDDRSLAEWMADIANGNPFYADSVLAHYRTTGERFVVPPQLSAIVDRRIRAVSPEARDVLETIVALGKQATIDRIERILATYGPTLVRHTRELGDARLIAGDRHVVPAHWLITESVQRNLIPLAARLLYRRIAAVLESELRTDGDSSELWECAQAWVAAGDSDHAADMIATCAEHALRIGRAREASDLYFRAGGMAKAERAEGFTEASIRAAVSGSEPGEILRAIPLLTSRSGRRVHDDIELAAFRARLWCDLEFEETLTSLRECVASEAADSHHRLAAARALMSFAIEGGLVLMAVDAAQSIGALLQLTYDPDDSRWLQCAVVFHSIYGNRAQAPELASRIVHIAGSARPDAAAELLNVAATMLTHIGRRDEGIGLWIRAHDSARMVGLSRRDITTKLTLASQYLDAGDVELAKHWFDQIVVPPNADEASVFLQWSHASVAAEFALFDGDRGTLRGLCERADNLPIDNVGGRTTRSRVILSCLLKHLRGEHQDAIGVAELLTREQVAGYEVGILGDFEMTVLITILRETDNASLAVEHLRQYLADRRRPYLALSANLLRAAASIGFTGLDQTHLSESATVRG